MPMKLIAVQQEVVFNRAPLDHRRIALVYPESDDLYRWRGYRIRQNVKTQIGRPRDDTFVISARETYYMLTWAEPQRIHDDVFTITQSTVDTRAPLPRRNARSVLVTVIRSTPQICGFVYPSLHRSGHNTIHRGNGWVRTDQIVDYFVGLVVNLNVVGNWSGTYVDLPAGPQTVAVEIGHAIDGPREIPVPEAVVCYVGTEGRSF
jgi:hypothetical protein